MKCLSIRQPFAWLIVNGFKDIENRSWVTKFRGTFLVHASKTLRMDEYNEAKLICDRLGIRLPAPNDLVRGCVVGKADVVGNDDNHPSPWFFGPNGILLERARPCKPIPLKGRLNFFESGIEKEDLKWIRKAAR